MRVWASFLKEKSLHQEKQAARVSLSKKSASLLEKQPWKTLPVLNSIIPQTPSAEFTNHHLAKRRWRPGLYKTCIRRESRICLSAPKGKKLPWRGLPGQVSPSPACPARRSRRPPAACGSGAAPAGCCSRRTSSTRWRARHSASGCSWGQHRHKPLSNHHSALFSLTHSNLSSG